MGGQLGMLIAGGKGPPGVPTNVSAAAATSTSASVTYTAPTINGGSTIISYTAVSNPGGFTGTLTQADSGTITVNGLTAGQGYTFIVYATNSTGNSANSDITNSIVTSAPPTVEYLVVAGGGGAGQPQSGNNGGGGGGAGGLLTDSALSVSTSSPYIVTVGAGGVAAGFEAAGTAVGSNSTFATITTLGGGTGYGRYVYSSLNGGSGGGGGLGTAGPPRQGYDGGPAQTGGGGGAGAVGGTSNGGNGLQSSITGVATYYAGGGAGSLDGSTGGLGGGGNVGTPYPTRGGLGAPNTGGGGGCGSLTGTGGYGEYPPGGSGGSGIVIIAYQSWYIPLTYIDPGLAYTVDTVTRSGYRVYKFTGGTGTVTWATSNTVPGAPTNIVARAVSSGTTSVAFTAPNYTGGSAITGYTAISIPGNINGTGSSSPVTVTGLTDGTAYTFTVKATNSLGTGLVSDIPSNSTTIGDVYYTSVGALIKTTSTNGQTNSSFVDSSPNGFTFTRSGIPSINYFNPYGLGANSVGGSVYFDGSSSFLSLSQITALSFGTNDFTIEAWIYPTTNPTGAGGFWAIIDARGGATARTYVAGLRLVTGNLRGTIYIGSDIQGTTNIPLNTWTHLAFSRSGTALRSFVNGVLDINVTNSTNFAAAGTQYIGALPDPAYDTGYMSSIRIVKGVAVYTGNFTPPSIAPLASDGPTSAASYSNTTNVNTTFVASSTSLLLNFNGQTSVGIYDAAYNSITTGPVVNTAGSAQVSSNTAKWSPTSILLNGTTDYLRLPYNSRFQITSQDFTIELWIYFNSVAINQRIAGQDNNSSTLNWSIYTTAAGTLNYYLGSTGTTWNIASGVKMGNIATGQWYHVALVRSGSTFTPYINGSSAGGVITTNAAALFTSTSALTIGATLTNANFLSAYVQDFRLTVGVARYSGTTFTTPTISFIAATAPVGPPRPPIIGSAVTATPTSAVVSFAVPDSDGGSTITSYTAVSSPGGLTGTISQSGSGSIIVTGLAQNTAYTFTVYATNAYGSGLASSASNSITTQTATTPFFSYLVVAGGGGGGRNASGGGGAGGLLTGNVTHTPGVQYTVTVGPGGVGQILSPAQTATSGTNSSISGTGLTTITAIGGGRAGTDASGGVPASGGSGGGGSPTNAGSLSTISTGGSGTTGQGNAGGNATVTYPNIGAGGGGGAGAPGTSNSGHRGGELGGIGAVSYLITAALATTRAVGQVSNNLVYFAGGGGGGGYCGSTISPIPGGLGGGGSGGESLVGIAGTANTGGGGGGGAQQCGSINKDGAGGGSGVVIINTPYTATATTGSVYVDTIGTLNIYTFIGSGTITF